MSGALKLHFLGHELESQKIGQDYTAVSAKGGFKIVGLGLALSYYDF